MGGFSLARVWAVLTKEFIQLSRDRITYAMILIMPIVQILLFGYAINNDPRGLPTAVLAQDHGTFARSVVSGLQNSGYFKVTHMVSGPDELDRLIARGSVQFAVTIPPDFSRRVVRGDRPQVLIEADATDPAATGGAVAALAALPSEALRHDLKGALAAMPGRPAFEVVIHRRYNPEIVTAYNIVPGLLGVILTMTLVMMTALGVTRERERGTMESLLATPVRPLEVMVGKLAPYVGVGVVQAVVVLTAAAVLFEVPMAATPGAWAALTLGVGLFIIGSLALGFLISTVARNQLQAMQMSIFYLLPSILLSGFAFPFRGMPGWAQALGEALPVTHVLRIVRGALLKGGELDAAAADVGALALFVLVVTTLAMARYRTTLD